MRIPLEYGDNFPVLSGSWNPAVPWRFPRHELVPARRGWWSFLLPWVTLGVGMTLGILWMNWHHNSVPVVQQNPTAPPAISEQAIREPSGDSSRPAQTRPVRIVSRRV